MLKGETLRCQPTRRRATIFCSIMLFAPGTAWAGVSERIVDLLNSEYGSVCSAKLDGWFNKTLIIDWTARTNKFHAAKILSEISTVKQKLYDDGVRYLKFPNDVGGYNIIDWKTGEKTSVKDKAPYYFR